MTSKTILWKIKLMILPTIEGEDWDIAVWVIERTNKIVQAQKGYEYLMGRDIDEVRNERSNIK